MKNTISGFVNYACFKDSAFTAVKRDAKFLKYVCKMTCLGNGYLFCQKWYVNGYVGGWSSGWNLPNYNFLEHSPLPTAMLTEDPTTTDFNIV